jgi:hypothetical protein
VIVVVVSLCSVDCRQIALPYISRTPQTQKDGLDEVVKLLQWMGERPKIQPQVFKKELVHSIEFFQNLKGREILEIHPQLESLQVFVEKKLW